MSHRSISRALRTPSRHRLVRRGLTLAVAFAAMLAPLGAAYAASWPEADRNVWTAGDRSPVRSDEGIDDAVNHDVHTSQIVGSTIFVGGNFVNIQPYINGPKTPQAFFAAFDTESGAPVASCNPVFSGAVTDIIATPDGSAIYVAGYFESVDGQPNTSRIVKLRTSDCEVDPSFAMNVTMGWGNADRIHVRTLQLVNDVLYVGGRFDRINNRYRTGAATVSAATGAVLDWDPDVAGGGVRKILVDPTTDRAYLSGLFASVQGQNFPEFAVVSASTGTLVPGVAQGARPYSNTINRLRTQHGIEDIALIGNRLVYIGDMHITVKDATTLNHVRAYEADGDPQTMLLNNGELLIGGHFKARVWQKATTSSGYCQQGASGCVWVLRDPNFLLRLDPVNFAPLALTQTTRGTAGVWTISAEADNTLWVGGGFSRWGARYVDGLARLSPAA